MTIVNSRAISVSGLTRGTKLWLYQSRPLPRISAQPGQEAREERNAEVDEDTLRDLADRDVNHRARQAEVGRKHRDEDPRVERVEQHLKKQS